MTYARNANHYCDWKQIRVITLLVPQRCFAQQLRRSYIQMGAGCRIRKTRVKWANYANLAGD